MVGQITATSLFLLETTCCERGQKWVDIGLAQTNVCSSMGCVGSVMQYIDKLGDTTAASLFLWTTTYCERGEEAEMERHWIGSD